MMPSGADYDAPEISGVVARHYQGAGVSSQDRVKLFKLAWDLVGDAFGSRQLQYERYYAGDPVRILAGNYVSCNDHELMALVDAACKLVGHPIED